MVGGKRWSCPSWLWPTAHEVDRQVLIAPRLSAGCLVLQELAENYHKVFRLLDVGQVTTVGNDFEGALLQTGNRLLCLGLREDSVGCAPDDKRWHVQLRKLVQQHLALPFEGDLCAQRCDDGL